MPSLATNSEPTFVPSAFKDLAFDVDRAASIGGPCHHEITIVERRRGSGSLRPAPATGTRNSALTSCPSAARMRPRSVKETGSSGLTYVIVEYRVSVPTSNNVGSPVMIIRRYRIDKDLSANAVEIVIISLRPDIAFRAIGGRGRKRNGKAATCQCHDGRLKLRTDCGRVDEKFTPNSRSDCVENSALTPKEEVSSGQFASPHATTKRPSFKTAILG